MHEPHCRRWEDDSPSALAGCQTSTESGTGNFGVVRLCIRFRAWNTSIAVDWRFLSSPQTDTDKTGVDPEGLCVVATPQVSPAIISIADPAIILTEFAHFRTPTASRASLFPPGQPGEHARGKEATDR